MAKTVCFGEIMLRLSPPGFERLFQSPALGGTFGGGEANVAVSLAQFGRESHYVGLVHGFVGGRDLETILSFAVAASALKPTIPGDFNHVSVAEVERLVAGDASGRVRR